MAKTSPLQESVLNPSSLAASTDNFGTVMLAYYRELYGDTVAVHITPVGLEALGKRPGISRASIYRRFPSKEGFDDFIFSTLSGQDWYGTEKLHNTADGMLKWVRDSPNLVPSDRNRLLGSLGQLCVTVPDYRAISNLESVIVANGKYSEVARTSATDTIARAKEEHVRTIAGLLRATHAIFGEETPDLENTPSLYAIAFNGLARGLSADIARPLQDTLFVAVADSFMMPPSIIE